MTVGGPLVNVALIMPLYVLSFVIPFFAQLGYMNMVILIFNLIPAFPSDGGRILRSVIAHYTKDYLKATTIACRLSQGICIGFGILGLMFMNFTLALIAFFLFMSAEAELRNAPAVLAEHSSAHGTIEEASDILSSMTKKTTKFRKRHQD
jgi:Zn-dependent protease